MQNLIFLNFVAATICPISLTHRRFIVWNNTPWRHSNQFPFWHSFVSEWRHSSFKTTDMSIKGDYFLVTCGLWLWGCDRLQSIKGMDIHRFSRSQQVSGRRPLPCWVLGFESHRGHGYLSVVSIVCRQVEVSATSWSLVQRSPTDCGASFCVI